MEKVDLFAYDVRTLNQVISDLLRGLDFVQAEELLYDALIKTHSHISDVCLRLNAENIRFSGWDDVFRTYGHLESKGHLISAFGIDISSHGDDIDPVLELSFYDDSTFPFSSSSRHDILAACPRYAPPWTGGFVDITHLMVHGLSEIFAIIFEKNFCCQRDQVVLNELGLDECAYILAQWWLYLKCHQALYREIQQVGLPKPMPVVLGEHDFGPSCYNVFMIEKITDYKIDCEPEKKKKSKSSDTERKKQSKISLLQFLRGRWL